MIPGTTPTFTFTLPFDGSLLASARISCLQESPTEVLVVKETADCLLDGDQVSATLTQEESLRFTPGSPMRVQLRVLTTSGESLATKPAMVSVGRCLDGEVLV